MALNFNILNASEQIQYGTITTPLFANGSITPIKLGVASSVVIQDITYTAVNGGTAGNNITVQYIEDGIAGLETVNVTGTAIVVHIGNHTVLGSTATQVQAAISISVSASLLVTTVISGTPSNIQLAVSATHLTGGAVGGTGVSSIHADSNSNLVGNVQLVSGTNVTLSQSGQAITISATGASAGVSSLNSLTGTLTLSAGSNITITPSGNTLTIASSGGGSGITTLTGDVTAGPGSGSQVATIAATLSGKTFTSTVSINPTTNQLILGGVSSGHTITLTAPAPSANRIYTIADAGVDASFIMNEGNQSINGSLQLASATAIFYILNNNGVLTEINTTKNSGSSQAVFIPDSGMASANFVLSESTQTLNGTYTFTHLPILPLTSANVFVGNGSNVATAVALSGDVSISNSGVASISSGLATHFVTREVPTGLINSSNVTFTLANMPVVGTECIYLNGLLQNSGVDYTISGVTVTFTLAPVTGSVLLVNYRK